MYFFCESLDVPSEKKIRDLCAKISSLPEGSKQFWKSLVELRDVVEEHTALLRKELDAESKRKSGTRMVKAS
jgi:hypothetical protein